MGRPVRPYSGSSLFRTNPEQQKAKAIEALAQDDGKQIDAGTDIQEADISELYKESQQRIARPETGLRCMSARTRRKVKDKAFALIYSTGRPDFYFMTLTFVNRVGDQAAVKILNRFLTTLREESPAFSYIWVAERQNNNKAYPGNIHFHVITDLRIDIGRFNALWVLQQYNAGIMHPNISYEQIAVAYRNKTVKTLLNPLDVKHARNIDKIAAYLTTYITKNKDEFACSPWRCSHNVSRLCTAKMVSEEVSKEAENKRINKTVNVRTKKVYAVEAFVTEYAIIRTIYNKQYFKQYLEPMNEINAYLLYLEPAKKPAHLPPCFEEVLQHIICLN